MQFSGVMLHLRHQVALISLLVLASAGAAHAQAPHVFDETDFHVRLYNPDPEGGYLLDVGATVTGVGSGEDAIRVTVRAGSRELVTTRCSFERIYDDRRGRIDCRSDASRRLESTGALVVELAYVDDVAETTTVLRTLHVTVRGYPYWVRDDARGRPVMGTNYQIDGSDLLGSAFVYMQNTGGSGRVFLFNAFSGPSRGLDGVLRCRVGDVRIPDRRISAANYADYTVEERVDASSDTRVVGWYRMRYDVLDLWWGTRIEGPGTDALVFLGDHPGDWSCDVRSEGEVLRTFRFSVDAAGIVVPHALEADPGFPPLLPGLHVCDVRLPAASARDAAIDPDAIRAGFQYGTPWAVPAAVADMLAALPRASGTSLPTARGRRRR